MNLTGYKSDFIRGIVAVLTVSTCLITGMAIAPSRALNPSVEQSYRGQGRFQFREQSIPIQDILYRYTNGNSRTVQINLSNGRVMQLEGVLSRSNRRTILTIQSGGFTANRDADMSGELTLNVINGKLRGLKGNLRFDSQPISIDFTSL
ncbi:hypothetical protein ACKFKG_12600 [Phormidesmis sp. 146-35]